MGSEREIFKRSWVRVRKLRLPANELSFQHSNNGFASIMY